MNWEHLPEALIGLLIAVAAYVRSRTTRRTLDAVHRAVHHDKTNPPENPTDPTPPSEGA